MVGNNCRMDSGAELKRLRERTGLSLEKVAKHLGMPRSTSYDHYERRTKREYIPMKIINALIPLFGRYGIEATELLRLAGLEEKYIDRIRLNKKVLARLLKEVPEVSAEFGLEADAETLARLIADIYPEACEVERAGRLSSDVIRLGVAASKPHAERGTR